MTKEEIFKIALLCFNVSYDKVGEDSQEAEYCRSFLRSAELSCAQMHEWTFLQKTKKYEDSEKIDGYFDTRFMFGYEKPSDLISVYFINGKYDNSVQAIGNNIYFEVSDPEIVYISSDVDYDTFPYPDDYGYLLAYELAYEISDFIAPDKSDYKNMIMQKLQIKLELIRRADLQNTRRKNPHQDLFVI